MKHSKVVAVIAGLLVFGLIFFGGIVSVELNNRKAMTTATLYISTTVETDNCGNVSEKIMIAKPDIIITKIRIYTFNEETEKWFERTIPELDGMQWGRIWLTSAKQQKVKMVIDTSNNLNFYEQVFIVGSQGQYLDPKIDCIPDKPWLPLFNLDGLTAVKIYID
jgi:hypothetical protein